MTAERRAYDLRRQADAILHKASGPDADAAHGHVHQACALLSENEEIRRTRAEEVTIGQTEGYQPFTSHGQSR